MSFLPKNIWGSRNTGDKASPKWVRGMTTQAMTTMSSPSHFASHINDADLAHEIGVKYENILDHLDEALKIFQKIEPVVGLIEKTRGAVSQEFDERRSEHAELSSLRVLLPQMRARLEATETELNDANARHVKAEAELFEANTHLDNERRKLESSLSEGQDLRAKLHQATVTTTKLDESLKLLSIDVATLREDKEALTAQLETSESRRKDADSLAANSHQAASLAEEEALVLRRQVETLHAEINRMSRQISDTENALGAEKAKTRGLEASLASTQEENLRTNRSAEAKIEAARAELSMANGKLETYLAQAAKLEALNAQTCLKLNDALAEQRNTERQLQDLQIDFRRSEERVKTLEDDTSALRLKATAVEAARAAAVERSDQLVKQLHSMELSFKRSENRANELRERLESIQTETIQRRGNMAERLDSLQLDLEKERAERTMAEGALETLRRERFRPQSDASGTPGDDKTFARIG